MAVLHKFTGLSVEFASELRDILLLVFFTTIGLSAKFSALRAGGRPLAILCGVTVLLLITQNLVGIAIALINGAHPFYGLLAGAISFVGGPGTAIAWSEEAAQAGLKNATEIAMASATMAVVFGAMAAGPITGFVVTRHRLTGPGRQGAAAWVEPAPLAAPGPLPGDRTGVDSTLGALLLVAISVAIGGRLNEWATQADLVLPGFLTAMLGGALIANLGDAVGLHLHSEPVEAGGDLALRIFLVMSLMGMQLWVLGAALTPLLINSVLQIVITAVLAYYLVFRLLGKDYEAAVTMGGFLGFGLSSMPVAMATMEQITDRFGPAPRAFLLITLAGSFFVDLANALVAKAFVALPMFR
jgi:ESS family glutamate:Na+ symporter